MKLAFYTDPDCNNEVSCEFYRRIEPGERLTAINSWGTILGLQVFDDNEHPIITQTTTPLFVMTGDTLTFNKDMAEELQRGERPYIHFIENPRFFKW